MKSLLGKVFSGTNIFAGLLILGLAGTFVALEVKGKTKEVPNHLGEHKESCTHKHGPDGDHSEGTLEYIKKADEGPDPVLSAIDPTDSIDHIDRAVPTKKATGQCHNGGWPAAQMQEINVPTSGKVKTYKKNEFVMLNSFRKNPVRLGVHEGIDIYALPNKTVNFDTLSLQIDSFTKGKAAHLDIHFNKGGGSGPIALTNSLGCAFAEYYVEEMQKIYEEQGWVNNRIMPVDTSRTRLGVIKCGTKHGLCSVIGEFAFVDDRINGTKPIDFALTREGAYRIQLGILAAAKKAKLDSLTLSIGHHGPRGLFGAYVGRGKNAKLHEKDYAVFQINSMNFLLPGKSATVDKMVTIPTTPSTSGPIPPGSGKGDMSGDKKFFDPDKKSSAPSYSAPTNVYKPSTTKPKTNDGIPTAEYSSGVTESDYFRGGSVAPPIKIDPTEDITPAATERIEKPIPPPPVPKASTPKPKPKTTSSSSSRRRSSSGSS